MEVAQKDAQGIADAAGAPEQAATSESGSAELAQKSEADAQAAKLVAMFADNFAQYLGHIDDDVKAVAHPVLRHRVILTFNAEAAGVDADSVLTRIIQSTKSLQKQVKEPAS